MANIKLKYKITYSISCYYGYQRDIISLKELRVNEGLRAAITTALAAGA